MTPDGVRSEELVEAVGPEADAFILWMKDVDVTGVFEDASTGAIHIFVSAPLSAAQRAKLMNRAGLAWPEREITIASRP